MSRRANSSDRRVINLVKNLVNIPTVRMTVEGGQVIRRITRAECMKHTGVDLEVLWSEHWGCGNIAWINKCSSKRPTWLLRSLIMPLLPLNTRVTHFGGGDGNRIRQSRRR